MTSIQTTAVTPFDFGGLQVRTVTREGIPWFILADVCRALGLENPTRAASRLDDDEKNTLTIEASERFPQGIKAGNPNMGVVNESGLSSLILTSRKPEAKAFKKWITGTVLPALRKEGMYVVREEKVLTGEMSEDEMLLKAMTNLQAKVERLRADKDALSAGVVTIAT